MRPINFSLRTIQSIHLVIALLFFSCMVQALHEPTVGPSFLWQFRWMSELGSIISKPARMVGILPIKIVGFTPSAAFFWCLTLLWAIFLALPIVFLLKRLSQISTLRPRFNKKIVNNILFILSIFSFIIYNEYSMFKEPKFFLEGDKSDQFAAISGTIKLKIIFGDNVLIYAIKKGQLLLENTLPFPPNFYEQRPYNYYFMKKEVIKGPDIAGFLYNGPYRINNDKSLAIFSLSSIAAKDLPRQIVLLNWNTKEIIFRSNIDIHAEDIVWSPDSQMFAILETLNGGPPVSILATLAGFAGHPPSAYSYFLSIYDNKGHLIVKSKIANRLIISGGRLIWN